MRNALTRILLFLLMTVALSACTVVGGIFKAGMAVGIFVAVIIVILLFILFGRR